MSKRNAMRLGPDPHSAESVAWTVNRYGSIRPETLKEITDWLDKHKDEYSYRIRHDAISESGGIIGDVEDGIEVEHGVVVFPVLITNRKGSAIEKFIDNEHDAQNTLANIRNKDFPKKKQGQ